MAANFAEMLKAKRKEQEEKELADINQPRWNYILHCKHDLHDNQQCPMCLLVSMSTKKFLIEEAKELAVARKIGTYHRALIRYAMLDVWSRNQGSLAAERFIGLSMDIHLNGPVLDALLYFATSADGVLPSTASVVNGILRRKRILKIGQYASTYLQCRMRKVTTKKRLRKYFLRRFDFFPQDKYIKYDHYVDKKTSRRWKQQPRILRGERAGSPRTIARRINTEEKKNLDRKRMFEKLMSTKFKLDKGDTWTLESEQLLNMQRITLLKDTLSMAGSILHSRRFDFDEEIADCNLPKKSRATAAGRARTTPLPSAVWVSLSAPAPPTRALGLSIVLNSLPAVNDMSSMGQDEIEEEERDLEREAEEDALRLQAEEEAAAAEAEAKKAAKAARAGGSPPGSPSHRQQSSAFGFRAEPSPSSASIASANSNRTLGEASVVVEEVTPGSAVGGSRVGTAATAEEEPVPAAELTVNERVILMETFAWDALRCGTVEDVLTLLMCEELQAPFNSVMNIAEDDLGMWDYRLVTKGCAATLAEAEAERRAKEDAEAAAAEARKAEQKRLEEERRMEEKRKEHARRRRGAYADDDSDSDSADEAEKAAQAEFEEKKLAKAALAAGIKPAVKPVVEAVAPVVLPSKVLIAKRLSDRLKHVERFKAQVKLNTTAGAIAAVQTKALATKKRKEILELRRQRDENADDQFAVAMHVPTEAELEEEERWLAEGEETTEAAEEASAPVTDTQGHCRHDSLDVIPMTIHMRPCDVKKQNHECFRLFFLDFELVAITPWSPWAFHGEIIRSKDVIMNTLVNYAQRNFDLKKLMRQVVKKANEDDYHQLSRNSTAVGPRGGGGSSAPPRGGSLPGKPGGGGGGGQSMDDSGFCMDLYLPSERQMFPSSLCDVKIPTKAEAAEAAAVKAAAKTAADAAAAQKAKATATRIKTKKKISEENVRLVALSPMTQQSPLSPTDTIGLNEKFPFLNRLWEWKKSLKYARSKMPKVESAQPAAVNVKKQLAEKKAAIAAAAEKKKAAEKAAADKKAGIVPKQIEAVVVMEEEPEIVEKPPNEEELDEIAPDHDTAVAYRSVAKLLKDPDNGLKNVLGGPEVFKAACLDLPGWVEEKELDKEKEKARRKLRRKAHEPEPITAGSLKEEDYLKNLKTFSTLPDTSMAMRLSFNEGCGELPARAVYDLVCVEVTLDLTRLFEIPYSDPMILKNYPPPKTDKEKKKLLAMKAAAKEQLGKLPKTLPAPHFHQLVGVYPSSTERAPSSVDTGLFEWEYFRDYRGPQPEKTGDDEDDRTVGSGSAGSGGAGLVSSGSVKKTVLPPIGVGSSDGLSPTLSSLGPAAAGTSSLIPETPQSKNAWDQPNASTGIQTYYGVPGGSFTKTFQMKLMGKEPPPDYFAQNMPRKIRLWLGI